MIHLLAIALFAGVSSAFLTVAATTLGGIGVFVTFLSPLPLMLAAIGWHPLLALIGGALTAAGLTEMLGWRNGLSFALTIVIPAYVVARIIWEVEREKLVGSLVLAACWYAALAIAALAMTINADVESYRTFLRKVVETVLQQPMLRQYFPNVPEVGTPEATSLINLMVQIFPVFHATLLSMKILFNVWLACHIARRLGWLQRDWAPVWTLRLPGFIVIAAVATILLSALPGYAGFLAELLSNGTTLAITFLGYAAVHDATRGSNGRTVLLTLLWAGTFLLAGIPAIVMLFAGIAEIAFGWRERMRAGRNS